MLSQTCRLVQDLRSRWSKSEKKQKGGKRKKTGISDQNECVVPVWQFQTFQRSTPEVETMVLREFRRAPRSFCF
jgi:hypothetical protein